MKKNALILVLLGLLGLLATGEEAAAMTSANYRMDWFTPLTTGGGGSSSSANYAVNITVGQTISGAASSTDYKIGLGYWYSGAGPNFIYLPLILR